MNINKQSVKSKIMNKKTFLLLITAVSALGGLLFGYDTGVINGAQFYLSKHFDLDSAMKGWVVGSALLGCLVGAIGAGPLSIKFGRKHSLILSAILFSLSAYGSGLPVIFSESVSLLVVFRIIGGLGIGIASMNAPMYIAEIAPSEIRGKMVTYYQLAIVVGFFVVFLATYFIGNNLSEAENIEFGWKYMFWSELIPSCLFFILLFFVPKSPRWLALKGNDTAALEILTKKHNNGEISFSDAAVKNSDDNSALTNKGNLGYFTAFMMVYDFESAAYGLNSGEISMPVLTKYGYHLIKINDKREALGKVKVAHIMFNTGVGASKEKLNEASDKINRANELLADGEAFELVAEKFSEDRSTAVKGGVLPTFGVGKMVPKFEEVAFSLKNVGDISVPFATEFGYHIIKLLEKQPISEFDIIKADLKRMIANDSRSELSQKSLIEKLRSSYKVRNNMSKTIVQNLFRHSEEIHQLLINK